MLTGLLVALTGASVMLPLPPLPLLPLHVNVPVPTLKVGIIFKLVPEQITCVPAATLFPTGIGFTVMVIGASGAPGQPFALGVIIYCTVPPRALVNV